jgi:hypothetical protein
LSNPLLLQLHSSSRDDYVESIAVEVAVSPTRALQLSYTLTGNLAAIRIPCIAPAKRTEGLWQHTCFEAFIRSEDNPAYREFNFSPSGGWQAYTFADYRNGCLLEPSTGPAIECLIESARLTLHATIQPDDLPPGTRLRIGLTAVVEADDGALSYWALRHAAGKPDFHHPDTFALEITP